MQIVLIEEHNAIALKFRISNRIKINPILLAVVVVVVVVYLKKNITIAFLIHRLNIILVSQIPRVLSRHKSQMPTANQYIFQMYYIFQNRLND